MFGKRSRTSTGLRGRFLLRRGLRGLRPRVLLLACDRRAGPHVGPHVGLSGAITKDAASRERMLYTHGMRWRGRQMPSMGYFATGRQWRRSHWSSCWSSCSQRTPASKAETRRHRVISLLRWRVEQCATCLSRSASNARVDTKGHVGAYRCVGVSSCDAPACPWRQRAGCGIP